MSNLFTTICATGLLAGLVGSNSALAQDATAAVQAQPAGAAEQQMPGMAHHHSDDQGKEHGTMPQAAPAQPMQGMQHDGMDHGAMSQQAQPMPGMDMGASGRAMQMGPMQGGKPPPDARDPNAYAEGTRNAGLPGNEMNDEAHFGRLLVNNAEFASGDGAHGQNLDADAWYGGDFNKAWFKAEGSRQGGRLESLRTEALWDHAIAPFWDSQLGIRHDTGGGPARNWLAAGVRGLAPYWFDVEAAAYWRGGDRFGVRLAVRYELLFTQRLILEPELKANLYSRSDPERGIGAGLSDMELGLRLRYEIQRQFAPYIGVTWHRRFGGTAGYAIARGEGREITQAVAGVRMWF